MKIEVLDDAKKAAEILFKRGIKNVLITLGKNGSLYYDGADFIHCQAIPSVAVDTTGAGDSFNGGLCVALAEGKSVTEALNFASCVAAIAITRPGAADAMPSREETNEIYNKYFSGE